MVVFSKLVKLVTEAGRQKLIPDPLAYQDTSSADISTARARMSMFDPIKDLALLEVKGKEFGKQFNIGGTDDLTPGSAVLTAGFPHANLGRLVLTEQTATVGAKVLIAAHGIKTKHIILNTQTRPSQSGGPVIDLNKMSVAGVIIGSYAPGGGGGIDLGGVDPQGRTRNELSDISRL